jgi:hypothetical protein
MAIRNADFDAFFGKPIPSEGFTIEEIVREYFAADTQTPTPIPPPETSDNATGPQYPRREVSPSPG